MIFADTCAKLHHILHFGRETAANTEEESLALTFQRLVRDKIWAKRAEVRA